MPGTVYFELASRIGDHREITFFTDATSQGINSDPIFFSPKKPGSTEANITCFRQAPKSQCLLLDRIFGTKVVAKRKR